MDILQYTQKHNEYRKRVREFVKNEVTPFADQWEKDRIVPKSVWRKMGEKGFLCPTIAPEYGGQGLDFLYAVILAEETIRCNQSGLSSSMHSDIIVPYVNLYGSEKQKKKYLPKCVSGEIITAVGMSEPGAGSDLASIQTTAVEEGDEIVINGSKIFISNGINCGLIVLAAKDPLEKNPYKAISMYLIEADTPGFEKANKLDKMGLYAQDTAELFFSKCRIPKENLLGQKGKGFYMLMEKLQQERLIIALQSLATVEYIFDQTIEHCKATSVSGIPISKSQANQFALVEMATEVKIARTFMDKLITEHIDGKNVVIETSMAKYWITEMAKKVTEQCLEFHGKSGLLNNNHIARAFRDARVMTIVGGTTEIMKSIIGNFLGL